MIAPCAALDALPDTAAALCPHEVPEDVIEDARYAVADTLAAAAYAMTTGATTDAPDGADTSRAGPAGVWWTGRRADLADATFANAYRVHSSDFDSVHYLTFGHPAAVSLPPLLGLYESGVGEPLRVLVGYVLSVEIMAMLGARFGTALRAASLHPTVVLGAPACAASCTWLLGGGAEAIRWAMAYAASTTIGFDTHFGSDIKPLQVAACARAGLHAAQLAVRGNRQGPRMPWYAPVATLAGVDHEDSTPHAFGQPWAARVVPTRCKTLPVCGYFDPVLAAWQDRPACLREPEVVRRVTVEGPEYLVRANRFANPTTLDEARFSLPFLIALLLRHQEATPAHWVPARLADDGLRRTMAAVDVTPARTGESGAILLFGGDREWSLPLRPAAAHARTSWARLHTKLADSGLAGRASEVVAHLRAFDTSTPTRWRALVTTAEEATA
jgi:2-methylcitrate dehydratase PrpD